MPWATAGVQSNPATDAILADSGNKGYGPFEASVIFGGNVAAVAVIEHRDTTNTSNINSQVIACAANQCVQVWLPGVTLANERIRVRLNAGVTGAVQASVFTPA